MAEPPKQDAVPPASEVPKADAAPAAPKYEPPKPPKPQNPALRMMGLPNFRFKLPSRNWMIFLTVTGSFSAAVIYDKRQKKAVQKKWCDLVADIAQRPLATNQMPRKLTIFLSAPPGDGIGHSRTYFKEYIKPILVAAAMDYDVIEGRKEGDVRYGTAEQIRRLRRKRGESGSEATEEDMDTEQAIDMVRDRMHVEQEPGLRGDLVLGRHTWKEYIRGLHEGWLGPLEEPPVPQPLSEPSPIHPSTEARTDDPDPIAQVSELETKKEEGEVTKEEKKEEPKEEKKKPYPPPSYLPTNQYSSAPLSPHIPAILEPSVAIHQYHLLGFLRTPQRVYNFLNRRHLADQIGRETAALVLASYRPYQSDESFASTTSDIDNNTPPQLATLSPENNAASSSSTNTEVVQTQQTWEQQTPLAIEEVTWHKSVRKPRKEGDTSERIWINDIVLDPRIAERMRRFDLDPEDEERANRIFKGLEQGRARKINNLRAEEVLVEKFD